MQLLVRCGRRIDAPAEFRDQILQLSIYVAPLTKAFDRKKILTELLIEQSIAFFIRNFVLRPVPEFEPGVEVTLIITKFFMRFSCFFLSVQGSLARILNRDRRSNNKHFGKRLIFFSGLQHARNSCVQRQASEFPADLSQLSASLRHGIQLPQKVVTVGNRSRKRRFDKRKLSDVRQVK